MRRARLMSLLGMGKFDHLIRDINAKDSFCAFLSDTAGVVPLPTRKVQHRSARKIPQQLKESEVFDMEPPRDLF